MTILYSDSMYPSSKRGPYKGKTIGEILEEHPNPETFIRNFAKNGKYCLSDEVVVRKWGGSSKRLNKSTGQSTYQQTHLNHKI